VVSREKYRSLALRQPVSYPQAAICRLPVVFF